MTAEFSHVYQWSTPVAVTVRPTADSIRVTIDDMIVANCSYTDVSIIVVASGNYSVSRPIPKWPADIKSIDTINKYYQRIQNNQLVVYINPQPDVVVVPAAKPGAGIFIGVAGRPAEMIESVGRITKDTPAVTLWGPSTTTPRRLINETNIGLSTVKGDFISVNGRFTDSTTYASALWSVVGGKLLYNSIPIGVVNSTGEVVACTESSVDTSQLTLLDNGTITTLLGRVVGVFITTKYITKTKNFIVAVRDKWVGVNKTTYELEMSTIPTRFTLVKESLYFDDSKPVSIGGVYDILVSDNLAYIRPKNGGYLAVGGAGLGISNKPYKFDIIELADDGVFDVVFPNIDVTAWVKLNHRLYDPSTGCSLSVDKTKQIKLVNKDQSNANVYVQLKDNVVFVVGDDVVVKSKVVLKTQPVPYVSTKVSEGKWISSMKSWSGNTGGSVWEFTIGCNATAPKPDVGYELFSIRRYKSYAIVISLWPSNTLVIAFWPIGRPSPGGPWYKPRRTWEFPIVDSYDHVYGISIIGGNITVTKDDSISGVIWRVYYTDDELGWITCSNFMNGDTPRAWLRSVTHRNAKLDGTVDTSLEYKISATETGYQFVEKSTNGKSTKSIVKSIASDKVGLAPTRPSDSNSGKVTVIQSTDIAGVSIAQRYNPSSNDKRVFTIPDTVLKSSKDSRLTWGISISGGNRLRGLQCLVKLNYGEDYPVNSSLMDRIVLDSDTGLITRYMTSSDYGTVEDRVDDSYGYLPSHYTIHENRRELVNTNEPDPSWTETWHPDDEGAPSDAIFWDPTPVWETVNHTECYRKTGVTPPATDPLTQVSKRKIKNAYVIDHDYKAVTLEIPNEFTGLIHAIWAYNGVPDTAAPIKLDDPQLLFALVPTTDNKSMIDLISNKPAVQYITYSPTPVNLKKKTAVQIPIDIPWPTFVIGFTISINDPDHTGSIVDFIGAPNWITDLQIHKSVLSVAGAGPVGGTPVNKAFRLAISVSDSIVKVFVDGEAVLSTACAVESSRPKYMNIGRFIGSLSSVWISTSKKHISIEPHPAEESIMLYGYGSNDMIKLVKPNQTTAGGTELGERVVKTRTVTDTPMEEPTSYLPLGDMSRIALDFTKEYLKIGNEAMLSAEPSSITFTAVDKSNVYTASCKTDNGGVGYLSVNTKNKFILVSDAKLAAKFQYLTTRVVKVTMGRNVTGYIAAGVVSSRAPTRRNVLSTVDFTKVRPTINTINWYRWSIT